MATTTSPTTARAPKRTQEQKLTDVLTKLLANQEDRLAKMTEARFEASETITKLDDAIPTLRKKIAAQRLALGIDQPAEK